MVQQDSKLARLLMIMPELRWLLVVRLGFSMRIHNHVSFSVWKTTGDGRASPPLNAHRAQDNKKNEKTLLQNFNTPYILLENVICQLHFDTVGARLSSIWA